MFATKCIVRNKIFKQQATFKPTFRSTHKPIFKSLKNNLSPTVKICIPTHKFSRTLQPKKTCDKKPTDCKIDNPKILPECDRQTDMMFLYIIGGILTLVIFIVKNIDNSIRMYNLECYAYNPTKLFEHIWKGIGHGLMYGIPYSIVYPIFWSCAIFEHYKNKILCTYSGNIRVHSINLYFIPDAFYVIRQLIDIDTCKDFKQNQVEKTVIVHYYNTHIKLLEYYGIVYPAMSLNDQLNHHYIYK